MTAATWDGLWPGPLPGADLGAAAAASHEGRRLVLWDHCRNSLGIARLLVREGRPSALVHTACHLAVEMACRAALTVAGDQGLVTDAQTVLPMDLRPSRSENDCADQLAAAERAVGWVADYLRSSAPGRSWGF